jgi:hypothetical protein
MEDTDDAAELTDKLFNQPEIREGDKALRRGRPPPLGSKQARNYVST